MQTNVDTQPRNDAPFQKIESAVKTTGLSAYYLRQGCRNGSIPCVRSGRSTFQRYCTNSAKEAITNEP